MGLTGLDLRDFLKVEQDRERDKRAEERERLKEEKELAEIRLKIESVKLEQRGNQGSNDSTHNIRPPKLPSFVCGKDKLDVYLLRFERYAVAQKWPSNVWAVNLSALLTGKALDTYSRLSEDDAQDYNVVKTAILQRYSLTSDGFRKKFRSSKPDSGETAEQFIIRLRSYVDKWIEMSGRQKTFTDVVELFLIEQFYTTCSKDMETFIKERKPKGLKEVIEIADCFVEARSGWQGGTGRSHTIKPTSPPLQAGSKPAGSKPSDRSQSRPGGCYICGKLGHQARHCTQRKRKEVAAAGAEIQSESDRTSSMPKQPQRQVHDRDTDSLPESTGRDKRRVNRHESEMYDVIACSCFSCTDGEGEVTEIQSELALPIVSVAGGAKPLQLMPVKEGIINGTRVKVLRDSGCSTTFVKMELIKPDQFAGEERRCLMIDRTMRTFPVAKVTLDSPFFIGEVEALCVDNPIYDVVLGNIPGAREPKDPDEDWNGDTCLAVETRNQRKKESKPIQKLKVPKQTDVATAEEFRKEQANDATLGRIREQAVSGVLKTTRNGNRSLFRRKQGLLYREFQSASGDVTHQLVVPCKFRGQILRLAHECLLGGHLGSHKTAERILQNFFWGGVRADTSRFL